MSRKKARAPWQEDALKAIACLKNGGVILHATDTVWGLAADATNLAAVERIFEIKARPMNQPMLMLASNSRMVEVIQPHLPEEAWELMAVCDRPLTILAPYSDPCRYALHPALVNDQGACAVRLTQDPYCQFIIEGLGRPLVSSSANRSGGASPSLFSHVEKEIQSEVDYVGVHGQDNKTSQAPSMLVEFDENNRFRVIRS